MPKKPVEVVLDQRPSTTTEKSSTNNKENKCCRVCTKVCDEVKRCHLCKSGCYCSRECRKQDESAHEEICGYIRELEKIEGQKLVYSVREQQQVKVKARLVRLVGEKPVLNCTLSKELTEALWDTGAMVSMVSSKWLQENLPDVNPMSISNFLEGDNLSLCAANNTKVGVEGIVVLDFGIGDNYKTPVPFVVTNDNLAQPIIGYNVIEEVIKSDVKDLPEMLKKSCPKITDKNVNPLVNLIRAGSPGEEEVKVARRTILPPRSRCRVKCKTKLSGSEPVQSVVFSPDLLDDELEFAECVTKLKMGSPNIQIVVSNPTNSSLVLERGVVLGVVDVVSAVIPLLPKKSRKKKEVKAEALNVEVSADEKWLPPVQLDHLSGKEREIAEEILREQCDVFCRDKNDHGDVPDMEMELHLTDNVPVQVPHRHIPRPLYDEVKNFINDLIANKWIRESKSSYSSPIVCVRKKDQSLRLCIDYRQLNKKIIPDKQPIPRIQELFDTLGGQEWFSTLDMAKAYHQGYVKEEFRKFTAFSTPWALYEWIRIPMGISNAPPVFQRYINRMLKNLRDVACTAYLDDILIYGRSFAEHAENVRLVLQRLRSQGIKLRADKCFLFRTEVRYLGRLISKNGHRPDPADTEALEKFRIPPKNIGELRTLLGFLGYYRRYVRDFAKKFQPIYDLLKSGHSTKKQPQKGKQLSSKQTVIWTPEFEVVVNEVIDYLKSPDFLVFPDYNLPFRVHCDASKTGLGAVLYQKVDGKDRVVSFASRTLTDPEKKYHLHSGKLEFLALKWSVTDRFSDYLSYTAFTVYTDNNPLTYVMSTAKLNATGLRWVAELANYQFSIFYRPGKACGDADGLSRQWELEDLENECTEEMKLEDMSTVMSVQLNSTPSNCSPRIDVNILSLDGNVDMKPISMDDLMHHQKTDPVISPIYRCVEEKRKPTKDEWKSFSKKSKVLMHQFSKLKIRSGVLVRKISGREQLVLPLQFHQLVFTELHEKMGHLGAEKVEELSRQRFYWPFMKDDIQFYIEKKCACIANKAKTRPEEAPLFPIVATSPFELVSIDYLKLDLCKGKFQHVLLVTDHFTRFSQGYATKNQTGKSAADKLFNEFILQFGFPKRIHHDRGSHFNNELFYELHKLAGIKMSNTTPYHPMGNGQVERLNRTLINMLRAIPEPEKKNWKAYLPKLMFAYNSTINKTTGFSPYFLLFGRESQLPIDCILPVQTTPLKRKTYDQFARDWKKSMKEAFQIANQKIEKARDYNKKYYDSKIKYVALEVGDHVLVRNVEKVKKGCTGKLRSTWEHKIYKVIEKHDLVPVYTVKPLGERKLKTVHRNMLLKVNDLPIGVFGQKDDPIQAKTGPTPRKLTKPHVLNKKVPPTLNKKVSPTLNKKSTSVPAPQHDEHRDSTDSSDDDMVIAQAPSASFSRGKGVDKERSESFEADSLEEAEGNDQMEVFDEQERITRPDNEPENEPGNEPVEVNVDVGEQVELDDPVEIEELELNEQGELQHEIENESEGEEEIAETEDELEDNLADEEMSDLELEDIEPERFLDEDADEAVDEDNLPEIGNPESDNSSDESYQTLDETLAYPLEDDPQIDTETDADSYHDALEHQVDESSNNSSETDDGDEERPVTRKSSRNIKPRQVYTYDTLGGTPRVRRFDIFLLRR